jgi:hypothetical protein
LFPRKESGIEAARGIIAKSKYMGRDREEERTKLRATRILNATSMGTIMQIIDEVPTANAAPRPSPFEPKD